MDTFAVVGDRTRRDILDLLAARERSAGEIAAAFPVSQPAVSRHLRVLREAGLVSVRGVAQRRIYRLEPDRLAAIDAWLQPYRRLWADRLDALERHLDSGAPTSGGAAGRDPAED